MKNKLERPNLITDSAKQEPCAGWPGADSSATQSCAVIRAALLS